MRFFEVILGCLLLAEAATAAADDAPNYLLYTRRNGNIPQRIEPDVESLLRSSFYALEPVVVSIPNLLANSSEHLVLVSSLLAREPCNVFAVDLAKAQSASEIVESVSGLVVLLHRQFNVPLRAQQLVGFGGGAHLAGAAAGQVQLQLGEQLARITALDPSGNSDAIDHRLSEQDAIFVEVVHTNGVGLGTMARLGDVDYYPNWGQQQPGCSAAPDSDACAHERALHLAAEMWSPANSFISAQCSSVENMSARTCRWSTLRMGEKALDGNATGIYFLETRASPLFGRGAYHIAFL